jgi:transposase
MMTDGQWALLAPLLPAAGSTGGRGGRPEKWDRRLVLDAIFYLVRGGIAWRALPADFPPHQTVYALFRRWTRARAWCRIYAALRERARLADGRGPVPTAAVIDSQTVRAADTVPTASSGYDGGKKIKGRKRHVAVNTGGLLLAVVVMTPSLQDRDGAFRITAALREALSTITALCLQESIPVLPCKTQPSHRIRRRLLLHMEKMVDGGLVERHTTPFFVIPQAGHTPPALRWASSRNRESKVTLSITTAVIIVALRLNAFRATKST